MDTAASYGSTATAKGLFRGKVFSEGLARHGIQQSSISPDLLPPIFLPVPPYPVHVLALDSHPLPPIHLEILPSTKQCPAGTRPNANWHWAGANADSVQDVSGMPYNIMVLWT